MPQDATPVLATVDVRSELAELRQLFTQLASEVDKLKPIMPSVDKDTLAVALMLTMTKPTKRKIARAMGYADHTGLRNLPKFNAAWERFQIMQTVTGGNGRSVVGFDGRAVSA